MKTVSIALATVWLATFGATIPTDAAAVPPPPLDLTVEGGADSWHPTTGFYLEWRNPAMGSGPGIVAVSYRVRDEAGGTVVGETRIDRAIEKAQLQVPRQPGAYTAEVWLEDANGGRGAAATAKLRFDEVRPPQATPREPPPWIGRTAFPLLTRIDLGAGALPISGIRGYAVSVDRIPERAPCASAAGLCTNLETDLRGGASGNVFAIDELPEGTSFLHVVAVSGSGMRSVASGHATLRVDKTDPVTQLSGAPDGWASRPVTLTATATDTGSGMSGGEALTAIRIDDAPAATAAGNSVAATVIEPGVHEVAYYARDAAGNVKDGGSVNGQRNESPATVAVKIDREAPQVAFAVQDPADPELIGAQVIDPLSGPDLERGRIGVRRADSGDPFAPMPTEIVAGRLRARWDSEANPPGEYEFEAIGYDLAGNLTRSRHRLDGSPMLLRNPLKATTSLSAGFGGSTLIWHSCARRRGERRCRREAISAFESRPTLRVVPYGRGTLFSGRLAASGGPIEGATVQMVERLGEGGDRIERISSVRTGSGGRFSVRLPSGPSREIAARFEGTRTLDRSATAPIRLGVRSGVRLRVSSRSARIGGRPVVFSGTVLAANGEIPDEGKSVSLQFRLPGRPWTEFRTIQTDRHGRFRHAYGFSDDDSRGVRFLSAPTQRHKATGRTSPEARGQSPCWESELSSGERRAGRRPGRRGPGREKSVRRLRGGRAARLPRGCA